MRKRVSFVLSAVIATSTILFGVASPAHGQYLDVTPALGHEIVGSRDDSSSSSTAQTVTEVRLSLAETVRDTPAGAKVTVPIGDFDGKGGDDVVAVSSQGNLLFYPALADGSYGKARVLGSDWNSLSHVFGGIDVDGDDVSDILATSASGALYLYRGTQQQRFSPRITIASAGFDHVRDLSASPNPVDGDVVISGISGDQLVQWHVNAGDIAYQQTIDGDWKDIQSLVLGYDVSGDGFEDLWAIDDRGHLQLCVAKNEHADEYACHNTSEKVDNRGSLYGQGRAVAVVSAGHIATYDPNSFSYVRVEKPLIDSATPSSIAVLVNKRNPLPTSYAPKDLIDAAELGVPATGASQLRKEAAEALAEMYDAAERAGVGFTLRSGYRSYATQKSLFGTYVSQHGLAYADRISARAAYSEHQTGLAVDITTQSSLTRSFGATTAGKWLAENAYKYGFILRYPKGAESITGFSYEPWHFRYVGTEISRSMHDDGVATFEEYLRAPSAPSY